MNTIVISHCDFWSSTFGCSSALIYTMIKSQSLNAWLMGSIFLLKTDMQLKGDEKKIVHFKDVGIMFTITC